jgi:hypothetical protein
MPKLTQTRCNPTAKTTRTSNLILRFRVSIQAAKILMKRNFSGRYDQLGPKVENDLKEKIVIFDGNFLKFTNSDHFVITYPRKKF